MFSLKRRGYMLSRFSFLLKINETSSSKTLRIWRNNFLWFITIWFKFIIQIWKTMIHLSIYLILTTWYWNTFRITGPLSRQSTGQHDDVIKWKHVPRHWPFVQGIHRSPVNSPHNGQCRGALMFSLICAWINGWVNNGEAGDLRRHSAHYDVTIMAYGSPHKNSFGALVFPVLLARTTRWTDNRTASNLGHASDTTKIFLKYCKLPDKYDL